MGTTAQSAGPDEAVTADPFVAPALAGLAAGFDAARDPERAARMTSYVRDQFPYYGIPAPAQRAIARATLVKLPTPTETELVAFALACWERPQREWQYVACDALAAGAGGSSAALLPAVKRLITTKSWWDTVDSLAPRTVGTLVRAHPDLGATMDDWALDDNLWLARSAIIHQLSYKQATDVDRLFAYCTARAADADFFLRKAIGWALRQYARTDPDAVRAFVADHDAELSGLSKREALRHLS